MTRDNNQQIRITVSEPVRINKYLAELGVASRRDADNLISKGDILLNGRRARLGEKCAHGDTLTIKTPKQVYVYALYYKPRGEITGAFARGNLHPVGRLDKESEGLLVYTNDYRVTGALLSPENKHEKEYVIDIRELATPRVERIMLSGIKTQEAIYQPVKAVSLSESRQRIRVTLTEGKKHELRRMMNALFLTVTRLVRVRVVFLSTKGMHPGFFRELTEFERERFLKTLGLS